MKSFDLWREYLDEDGKLTKPKISTNGDFDPKEPKAPELPKVVKDQRPVPVGKPAPYRAPDEGKPKKSEEGLGDKGDKALIIKTPANGDLSTIPAITSDYSKIIPKTANNTFPKTPNAFPKKPKTTNEEFYNKTKGMSTVDFVNYMRENFNVDKDDAAEIPTVTSYAIGKFHPHPPEAISYIVALCGKNGNILDSLVHEIKKQGLLKELLSAILDHSEGYDHMADLMGDTEEGPNRCKSLARSMDSQYGNFLKSQDDLYGGEEDGDMDESVGPPFGSTEEHDDEDEAGRPPEENDHSDSEEPEGDEDHSDHDDADGSMSDSDETAPEDSTPSDETPEDEPTENEPTDSDKHDEEVPESPAPHHKKLKKKFAHDHMINAMKNFDHMHKKMSGY